MMSEQPNLVNQIMAFEMGEMTDEAEILSLFQMLVNTGLAWKLQGSYGRTAMSLLNSGLIHLPPEEKP